MNTLLARIKNLIESRDSEITQLRATVSRLTKVVEQETEVRETLETQIAEIVEYISKFDPDPDPPQQ